MKKLSVIIPVYNASDYIEKALNSVLKQNVDNIEIICVNDGSTDNSLEVIRKYSSKHESIKIINQDNMGPAMARNNGITEAEGEFIAFLDADDIYLDKESLNKMLTIALKNDADMVSANLRKIKQDGSIDERYNPNTEKYSYFTKEEIINSYEYGIPWAFYKNIYKKDFLTQNYITFPDLVAGEDPIFLARILTCIDKIYTLPIDYYGYNHSIGGGLNIKINTKKKINDYILHYKEVFNIFDDEKFIDVLYDYKKEFIDYLIFRRNINNPDIKEIITREFVDDKHFKNYDYGYIIIQALLEEDVNKEDDYDFIKYCLFEESMLEDSFIEIDRLKDFEKISRTNGISEHILSYKQLKKIDEYTFEDKRLINGKVDKLKMEITHFIKSNNLILTSNSWKITGLLRSLKNNSGEK